VLNRLLLPALAATALTLSACGSDDSSDTGSAAPAASTPAASSPAADSGAVSTADSGMSFDASSTGEVTVKATEFAFSPMDIKAKAGKLKITMNNDGQAPHELVILKTDEAADALEVSNGRVKEDDSVGEISEIDGGKSASHTFDLKAGKYVIVCNVPGHYMKGMRGTLVVS
jgi:uncharacterized cupredoxin-like copper-binding protein